MKDKKYLLFVLIFLFVSCSNIENTNKEIIINNSNQKIQNTQEEFQVKEKTQPIIDCTGLPGCEDNKKDVQPVIDCKGLPGCIE